MASPRSFALSFVLLILSTSARGNSYVVTNTTATGVGSFHDALYGAASHAGPDTVRFSIPGAGVHTIVSHGILDTYGIPGDDTVVDGYTQPGSAPNTAKLGQPANAVIKIQIATGSETCEDDYWGYYPGFEMQANRCVLRGIAIFGDFCSGVIVGGEDNVVEGCAIGAGSYAIWLLGAIRATIGGNTPAARNVIGGFDGIRINGGSIDYPSNDNLIEGNYIQGYFRGITIDGFARGNTIGGHSIEGCSATAAGNVITNSTRAGIAILGAQATGTSILSNSIHSNGGLGIDIGDDGATPNDNVDADTGPNMTQNYPVIQAAHGTVISGLLSSDRHQTYTIQVFDNSSCDPVAGEGKLLFGETQVTTADDGIAHFAVSCAAVRAGRFYTATATDEDGNTSEFSPCFAPIVTAVSDGPSRFALHANVPNPFNPMTTIAYDMATEGRVDVAIFDATGHRIRTLVSEVRPAGTWSVNWDGRDDAGRPVSSGVYFSKMKAPGFETSRKMVLLK